MKKIRIAHIAGGLTTGGVESVIYNYFSHMDRKDYDLIYISYDTPDPQMQKRFEKIGFTVYSVTKKKENLWKSCKEVYTIMKKHKINIVHSHMTLMCFITSILGRMAGARVRIAHSHLAQHPSGIKKFIYWTFKIMTRITATDYFACGQEAAQYLYGKSICQKGKVTILNNAVEPELFAYQEKKRKKIRNFYAIEDKLCIGHVGRFTEQKNHHFLIEIFEQIHREYPETVLLSVGSGPLMEEIKNQVKEKKLEDAVIFTGSRNDIDELYQAMDIFVLPSLYEGLAVVLVEAQFAGLTIYTSDKVTKEIGITPNLNYIPLQKSAKEWAEEIMENAVCGRRNDVYPILKQAGYDIFIESKKLDAFYQKRVEKS